MKLDGIKFKKTKPIPEDVVLGDIWINSFRNEGLMAVILENQIKIMAKLFDKPIEEVEKEINQSIALQMARLLTTHGEIELDNGQEGISS